MNLKIFTVTTLLLAFGTTLPVISASEQDISLFKKTKKCIDCNLSNLNFYSTVFREQDLRNISLQGANLYGSYLDKSDLRNANLSHTNSKSAIFSNADLRNANFSNADISGANFCGADLRGVNWADIIYNKYTKCLPHEAINYVSTTSKKVVHNCKNNTSVSSSNKLSLTEDVNTEKNNTESIKNTTEIVRDILKLF